MLSSSGLSLFIGTSYVAQTEKWFYRFKQLLWVSASSASFIRSNQPGWERQLLSTSSTSPLGKDSVCKRKGGFKQEHLSCLLTASPLISKCSGKKLLERCTGCRWQGVGIGGLQGSLCEEARTAPCQTQLLPASSDRPTAGHR